MIRLIVTAAIFSALSITGTTFGQRPDVLHKENPDELYVYYQQHDDCTISKVAVETMIGGVLTRSRIKKPQYGGLSDLHLDVRTNCLDNDVFMTVIRFAEEYDLERPLGKVNVWIYHERNYGSFGTYRGDNDYLMSAIKGGVEKAITDYLKANFDL